MESVWNWYRRESARSLCWCESLWPIKCQSQRGLHQLQGLIHNHTVKLGKGAVWFYFSRLPESRELWALLHHLSVRKEKEQGNHLTEGIPVWYKTWMCKKNHLGKYKLHSHLCWCLSTFWALSWCLRASCLSSVPYPLFLTKALAILAILPYLTISEGSGLLAKKLSLHFGGPVAVSYGRSWKGALE